jgi:ABC-type cobalamin transport system ATPase subunit
MGVCSVVREAALAIDAAFGGDDPRVRSAAQSVASMPHWSEQRRLDLWEEHVEEVVQVTDQSSLAMRLLEEVCEFGRFNLYGAFRAEETAQEFRRLAARLSQHGVMLTEHDDVSEW